MDAAVLSPGARHNALLAHGASAEWMADPGDAQLARDIGAPVESVRRWRRELVEAGVVQDRASTERWVIMADVDAHGPFVCMVREGHGTDDPRGRRAAVKDMDTLLSMTRERAQRLLDERGVSMMEWHKRN